MYERLFGSKTADPAIAERIPPGQYKTDKFPVLHYGSVPHTNLATEVAENLPALALFVGELELIVGVLVVRAASPG